jgi:SAM-dependent methyltransferase
MQTNSFIMSNTDNLQDENNKESKKIEKISNSCQSWKEIFEKLPWFKENLNDISISNKCSLELLLKLNGHTLSPIGEYTIQNWIDTVDHIKSTINYNDKMNHILEIGCGAGSLLKMFDNASNMLYGIEPSLLYFNIVSNVFPNGNFINGDALELSKITNSSLDIILAHSSIQYFPDLDYFEKVVNMCYQKLKKGGKLVFTDLCDKDKYDKCMNYRIKTIGYDKYKEKYIETNLKHFYISRDEINTIIKDKFQLIQFTNAIERGDEDDYYRFNFFSIKK